ncbi:GNAT family N-acetyltransferase [Salinibacillus xinjiangensis]|uniref:GNAT family N-acetyltransferase n=1 Tax=Salinibacillus xinjiangensis TaxID=1229268 RepID=A0A6G1X8P0_9BACI|nr:GNAT family protein [Salinibacillus xinjiangensis]MRG87240.1 GNAT family N-acetyltransferase [Salinibacillus xinjiangensis]
MFTFYVDDDIQLKLLEKRDAATLFKVVDHSRSYLREWLPWVDSSTTPEDYHPIIEMWLNQFAKNDGFQVAILYRQEIVGMIGYHGINWASKQTSIGYWLAKGYQGKGIITKATKALVEHAFQELELNRVEIRCGVDNTKSRAIPERLGFQQEGIVRDGEFLYDHFHDVVIYSALARDWK